MKAGPSLVQLKFKLNSGYGNLGIIKGVTFANGLKKQGEGQSPKGLPSLDC